MVPGKCIRFLESVWLVRGEQVYHGDLRPSIFIIVERLEHRTSLSFTVIGVHSVSGQACTQKPYSQRKHKTIHTSSVARYSKIEVLDVQTSP
jgi:hypothetical protein